MSFRMKILFFIVHPSKFHLFRITINKLISDGHEVDITYTSKDVLDKLVRTETWSHKNLFPKGRKIAGIPGIINAGIYFLPTIWKLYRCTSKKKYDLFITDDLLSVVGRIRRVPTINFADDDYAILPSTRYLFYFSNFILAPFSTDLAKFESRKIPFKGYKQSAYLRPEHFTPDRNVVKLFNPGNERYFLIRLVSLTASHDKGKQGLENESLGKLIKRLQEKGRVYISAERGLPEEFMKYRLNLDPSLILHALAFADLFISDSQTMSAEAAFLGTPFIRFNSFIGIIGCLRELEDHYGLGFGIDSSNVEGLFEKAGKLIANDDLKVEWQQKKQKMLDDTIDLSAFMTELIEHFPESLGK